jgi:hypothetical protein
VSAVGKVASKLAEVVNGGVDEVRSTVAAYKAAREARDLAIAERALVVGHHRAAREAGLSPSRVRQILHDVTAPRSDQGDRQEDPQ